MSDNANTIIIIIIIIIIITPLINLIVDIDECSTNSHSCDVNAVCMRFFCLYFCFLFFF